MNRKLILAGLSLIGIILITVIVLLFTGPRMKYQPSVRAFEMKMPLPPEDVVSFNHRKFDPGNVSFPSLTKKISLKEGFITAITVSSAMEPMAEETEKWAKL